MAPAVRIETLDLLHGPALQALADASVKAVGAAESMPRYWAVTWIAKTMLDGRRGLEYSFAVLSEGGDLLGIARLLHVDRAAGTAEIVCWIGAPFRGQGYGTAAVGATTDFAFRSAGLQRLLGRILDWNAPALRYMDTLGYSRVPAPPGSDLSVCWYAVDRDPWLRADF